VDWLASNWPVVARGAGVPLLALALGALAHWLVFRLLGRFAGRTRMRLDDAVLAHCRGPSRLLLPLLALQLALPLAGIPPRLLPVPAHLLSLLLIGAVAWLLVRLARVAEELLLLRHDLAQKDNLEARKVYTQTRVLRRTLVALVLVLAVAAGLMTFDQVRQLGASILASAGVLSLVVGIAAQRTLANIIAGLQIAISQPIRIDDVVIVEGEWGRIEEITLTYVVVKIWDLRRLVVPVSYFVEKPFQNWTRVEADLLAPVYLHVDYCVPVDAVRQELRRLAESSNLWDGELCKLQVTGASERTLELRALLSAPDASTAWDLRCEVREGLHAYLQREHPRALPRLRAAVESGGDQDSAAGE
jgi:small-conductance mechanosensitive channel